MVDNDHQLVGRVGIRIDGSRDGRDASGGLQDSHAIPVQATATEVLEQRLPHCVHHHRKRGTECAVQGRHPDDAATRHQPGGQLHGLPCRQAAAVGFHGPRSTGIVAVPVFGRSVRSRRPHGQQSAGRRQNAPATPSRCGQPDTQVHRTVPRMLRHRQRRGPDGLVERNFTAIDENCARTSHHLHDLRSGFQPIPWTLFMTMKNIYYFERTVCAFVCA
mmetsp:Transcript_26860/g.75417  ORF Transcript_26860/g.75417 Transcript_26860/m.75417 type:complete len:218 (-) Transcript_26860:61-714(-)